MVEILVIDLGKIDQMARLARIALQPEERELLVMELEKVFHWVSSLEELTLESIIDSFPEPSSLRSDGAPNCATQAEILHNAPAPVSGFFSVPKVLDA